MQFPVPQFTDVEDRVIGSLTLKQFGILFAVGVVVFLAFSASKSILVTIFVFLLVGLPGLAVAFAKINGRPMYVSFGFLVNFFLSPKVLIFHKESSSLSAQSKIKDVEVAPVAAATQLSAGDTQSGLKEVNALLQKTAREEKEITSGIK